MLEDLDLENCPSPYKENCTFYHTKCHECRGFSKSYRKLHYSPIDRQGDLAYKQHPCLKEDKETQKRNKAQAKRDKRASPEFKRVQTNVRKGLSKEKKVLKQMGIQSTLGSGRVYSDGDGTLNLPDGTLLRFEHKARLADRNVTGPTKQEWEKGIDQGVNVFLTTSSIGTLVTLNQSDFQNLIDLIKVLSANQEPDN